MQKGSMLEIEFELRTVAKRIPLTISRGTGSPDAQMIWVRLRHQQIEGWGEAMSFGIGSYRESTDLILADLAKARTLLRHSDPWARQSILHLLTQNQIARAVLAAIDQALLDWAGKILRKPWWQIWGFKPTTAPATSVTIGINTPDLARQRVQLWREQLGIIRVFKVKLGSPQGITADQSMFDAVLDEIQRHAPPGLSPSISVDANGGWSLPDAQIMCPWLSDRGVDHVEQPLAKGQESDLPKLKSHCPVPILLDESCFNAGDIPRLAHLAQGINIKHFKCGGISHALEMIHTARAHGLLTMLGCYANGTLSNTAVAHLGSQVDYLDLDSHLNLANDPFVGMSWDNGFLKVPASPGFGVTLTNTSSPSPAS